MQSETEMEGLIYNVLWYASKFKKKYLCTQKISIICKVKHKKNLDLHYESAM